MSLMLLDAASLYFRAFYGVKASIPAPDGTPTNAVRGFLDMVSTLITRWSGASSGASRSNQFIDAV